MILGGLGRIYTRKTYRKAIPSMPRMVSRGSLKKWKKSSMVFLMRVIALGLDEMLDEYIVGA